MTLTGTKLEKFRHYAKISIVHLLIFMAVAGVIYGRVQKYVAEKEQGALQDKITLLQNQLVEIKK